MAVGSRRDLIVVLLSFEKSGSLADCQSLQRLVVSLPKGYGCILKKIARKSLQYIDILNCAGGNTFDSNATGANNFFFEFSFLWSFSWIISACPEVLRLPFVNRTYCCPVIGCLRANPHASASAALIALYLSKSSSFILSCSRAFKSS